MGALIEATVSAECSTAPASPLDERTLQIIDAGYALLGQSGLEGLTIRAVLMRTGLARRAFYERFTGKDDLLLAVFEHTIRAAADHYDRAVQQIESPLERLKLVVESIALGNGGQADGPSNLPIRRGAALSREHLRLADTRPDALQAALAPLLAVIARLLAEGMAAGMIRPCVPQRLAPLIYNLVATTMHTDFLSHSAERADRGHRERLATDIWDFCLSGVLAHGAR